MNLSQLMQLFSSPETIHNLEVADKFYASLITTVLGMGITFSALIILLFTISLMRRIMVRSPKSDQVPSLPASASGVIETDDEEEEIVAVISAALAASLQTSHKNIVIRNIRRVQDFQPQWNRAGIQNQLNSNINL